MQAAVVPQNFSTLGLCSEEAEFAGLFRLAGEPAAPLAAQSTSTLLLVCQSPEAALLPCIV